MRTTLTLDDDIGDELIRIAKETKRPFKQVVNDTLKRGLARGSQAPSRFDYQAHDGGLLPGIDSRKLNDLAWE